MFKKIVDLFETEQELNLNQDGTATKEELLVACGVLLLEMSGRDEDFAPEEVKTIFRVMKEKFQIEDDNSMMQLLEKAQNEREAQGKIDSFIAEINSSYSQKQKTVVLEMAREVMLADGQVETDEKKFLKQIAVRLQLPDEVFKKIIE